MMNQIFTRFPRISPSGNDLVSNTAPAPRVDLLITGRGGLDLTDAVIGEPLEFRLVVEPDSAFGIFGRDVEAYNDAGERLRLIDSQG